MSISHPFGVKINQSIFNLLFASIYSVLQFFYTVFIVLMAAVRAQVSIAVLLGFACLVAVVYFVYFYDQIND